jgi:hypothetical protein
LICDERGRNGGRDDVVARHDTADKGEVGRVFGFEDGGDFEEVLGTEAAWREQADDPGGGLLVVEAGVDGTAGDVELLVRVKGDAALADGPGGDAVHAEDGFVGDAVQMRDADMRVWRDEELEEVGGALGFMVALEKGDAEFADLDGFVHRTPFPSRGENAFGDLFVRTRIWGKGYGGRVRSSI